MRSSALSHEVLIPLTEEVLETLEKQPEEEKRTVAQIEKLFDALCARYGQETGGRGADSGR